MSLAGVRNVVLAGGGNRCWWQAGFWNAVAPHGVRAAYELGRHDGEAFLASSLRQAA